MIVFHVALYGLLAGASALAAAAVAIVLRSEQSRLRGIAFAAGFVAAQAVAMSLAILIGHGSLRRSGPDPDVVEGVAELLAAFVLLAEARRVHRHRAGEPGTPRTPRFAGPLARRLEGRQTAVLDRIGEMDTVAIVGAGTLLGVGGPKRLLLTLVAAAVIAAAALPATDEAALVTFYVALATVVVWMPVLLAVAWGPRAAAWTAEATEWAKAHRRTAVSGALTVCGVYFLLAGAYALLR